MVLQIKNYVKAVAAARKRLNLRKLWEAWPLIHPEALIKSDSIIILFQQQRSLIKCDQICSADTIIGEQWGEFSVATSFAQ